MKKKQTTKKRGDAKATAVLLRLSLDDFSRLDKLTVALAGRMPFLSRPALAHAAMLIGLAEIERDPAVLLPKP